MKIVAEWQGGKAAKLHVVNPATLQPCNPAIFASGNMPTGTDNDENAVGTRIDADER